MEERVIFPLLEPENEMTKKALADHRRLRRLFEDNEDVSRSLSLIEEELEGHIRFEERVLFDEIQRRLSNDALERLVSHPALRASNLGVGWEDEFWKVK